MKKIFLAFCLLQAPAVLAQYAPQAGLPGSDAVPASSTQISGWATACRVQRGLMQITDASLGYAFAGDSSLATGMADGSIVSLGDSGVAVVTFAQPITNGPGADFAVFENGFLNPANAEEAFLELAFVEVSSDGLHFFRFPAVSLTQTATQLSSVAGQDYMNARLLHNLAGKYIAGYGTPFDLDELAGTQGLDINRVTHVRIVDAVGSIGEHACYDSAQHKVNDPFPTAFPTGGFDLDAVAALHQAGPSAIGTNAVLAVSTFPNPVHDQLHVQAPKGSKLFLTDATGRLLQSGKVEGIPASLSVGQLSGGIYFLTVIDEQGNRWAGTIYKQ